MRGPAADRVATFASLVDKVPFDSVALLIRKQFFKSDSKKVDEIIDRLSSKTELNPKKEKFIDVNFALRVLLELYAVERRVFLKRLENIFNDHRYKDSDPISNSISFSRFGPIISANFKNVNTLEVASLYRLAWNLGKGKCTFASLYVALNQKGFFMHNIKVYSPQISDISALADLRSSSSLGRKLAEYTSLKSERQRATYAELYKKIEDRLALFKQKHHEKLKQLKQMVQVSAEPGLKHELESMSVTSDPKPQSQPDPTNFDDPLNQLSEAMSQVLTYIRVVRSVQMISTADTDHGFKQALLISMTMLRGFDALLHALQPEGMRFQGVLDAAARKIQRKAVEQIFRKRTIAAKEKEKRMALEKGREGDRDTVDRLDREQERDREREVDEGKVGN